LCFAVFKRAFILALAVHFLCCGWYSVGQLDNGWVSSRAEYTGKDLLTWYITSARWTLAQINGRTDQDEERTVFEKLYTCMCAVFTLLIMSLFVSAITAKMMQLQGLVDGQLKDVRLMGSYLARHKVSWTVAYFAREHVKNLNTLKNSLEDESSIILQLPKQLQRKLLFETRSPTLLKHPLFKHINERSDGMQLVCSCAITLAPARAAEVIFEKGDDCNCMFFIQHGHLMYSARQDLKQQLLQWAGTATQNQSVWQLQPWLGNSASLKVHLTGHEVVAGTWLAEAALWLQWRNRGELVATSDSHVMKLSSRQFADIVKDIVEMVPICTMYAHAFYDLLTDIEPSDLLPLFPPADIERFCFERFKDELEV